MHVFICTTVTDWQILLLELVRNKCTIFESLGFKSLE